MLALEFVRDSHSREPAPDLVSQIIVEARTRGLILLKAGLAGNVLRLLVLLVIE
jgi:4-aminobutyrate aminotransferase/(S)-3-amino-2-methylpropionate transaminase